MTSERRLRLTRIVERNAIGLVFLDVVLYFAVVQPIRNMAQQKLEDDRNERLKVLNEESRVRRLESYRDGVPRTAREIDQFFTNEIHPKRRSFTRAMRLTQGLAAHSGVQITGIGTRTDPLGDEPLERMNLAIIAKGPFRGLLSFAHGLETTSSEFVVIHDFSFEAAEGADLQLRLAGELYLTR